jgi:hypothetical protein
MFCYQISYIGRVSDELLKPWCMSESEEQTVLTSFELNAVNIKVVALEI